MEGLSTNIGEVELIVDHPSKVKLEELSNEFARKKLMNFLKVDQASSDIEQFIQENGFAENQKVYSKIYEYLYKYNRKHFDVLEKVGLVTGFNKEE